MRTRATFLLTAAALVQTALLVAALAVLVLRLRDVRADLTRLESGERAFFNQLAETERNMYRCSILLRDYILVGAEERPATRRELSEVLRDLGAHPIQPPAGLAPGLRSGVDGAETSRREFVDRARALAGLDEQNRRALGPQYLPRQLAPLREKFVSAAREMNTLVRSLRESRNRATAESLEGIQAWILRILSGAALLGLAVASVAIWRFRHYEHERDVHLGHLQRAEDSLRGLSQKLVESQELERKNLSRELHDEVGQILTALRVQLGQIAPGDSPSAAHLTQASELAERSLRTVRDMARGLRPAMLDDLGLGPALKWLGRDFSKNSSLDVEVQVEGELDGLDEAQRTCLYRVAQESLTNCAKHSLSPAVRVVLHGSPGEVVLTVQDNGAGFAASNGGGIGLLGMRERVEELEGDLAVVSSPQAGTLIRAILPKTRRAKHDSDSHTAGG